MDSPRSARSQSCPLSVIGPDDMCCKCKMDVFFLMIDQCGHKFCIDCLDRDMIDVNQQNVICPECHNFGTCSRGRRREDTGFVINDYIETSNTVERDILQTVEEDSVECQSCRSEVSGSNSFFCSQCQVIICKNDLCLAKHKGHELVLGSRETYTKDRQICWKHSYELQYYCMTCSKALCKYCLTSAEHRKHKVELLRMSADRAKTLIKQAQCQIDTVASYNDWVYNDLRKTRKMRSQERNKVESKIRARAQEARDMIQDVENAAIFALDQVTEEMEKKDLEDENRIAMNLCALRAKSRKLTSSLRGKTDMQLMELHHSVQDMIRKSSSLGIFTSMLPDSVRLPRDGSSSTSSEFRKALEKYVGGVQVQMRKLQVPAINIVSQSKVTMKETDVIHKICSGGRGSGWRCVQVWLLSSSYQQSADTAEMTRIQLLHMPGIDAEQSPLGNISDRTMQQQQMTDTWVDLVSDDQHSAIASGRHLFFQLHEKRTIRFPKQKAPFTIFSKGRLRACLRYSEYFYQLQPSVRSLDDVSGDVLNIQLCEAGMPVSMDTNANGQIFAVVTSSHKVSLYQKGSNTPYSTYPDARLGHSTAVVMDACFFTFGSHEVLLVADQTEDDVIAFDFHRRFCKMGSLTNGSGDLSRPVALNVDPYTGLLLVLLSPDADNVGKVAVCSPTGVPLSTNLGRSLIQLFHSPMKM